MLSIRKNSVDICYFLLWYFSLSKLGTYSSQSVNLSMFVNIVTDYGFTVTSPMQNLMNSIPIKLVKSFSIVDIYLKKFLLLMSVLPNCFTSVINVESISPLLLILSKGITKKTFFFVLL